MAMLKQHNNKTPHNIVFKLILNLNTIPFVKESRHMACNCQLYNVFTIGTHVFPNWWTV